MRIILLATGPFVVILATRINNHFLSEVPSNLVEDFMRDLGGKIFFTLLIMNPIYACLSVLDKIIYYFHKKSG